MLPIYIICHANCEPPGYLCTYFDKRNISYIKTNIIENETSEPDLDTLSGLVFMGGPYGVNDNHPWLDKEIALIRKAVDKNIPLMGVCFGAQLISKALGAEVRAASHMEAGWHRIVADRSRLASVKTLSLNDSFEAFEWHEDTFTIPEGAIPIFMGSGGIENQGYLYGKILTMQFHLEMTEHMVYDWLERYKDCMPDPSDTVQSPEQITEVLDERLDNLHIVADKIYDWWLSMVNK